jgi:hypothetical protein
MLRESETRRLGQVRATTTQPTPAATLREHPLLAPQAFSSPPPLVALSEQQRAAAMARFEVLKAYLHHGVAAANRLFDAMDHCGAAA